MATIALICEGVSESKILSSIIERYLGADASVNTIQPPLTERHGQEKQDGYGGWLQVLRHCTDETVSNTLATNDYLVIQIDTDACSQPNYDVDIYDDDHRAVPDTFLYDRVCTRLLRDLSEDVRTKYADRILFAVCFNETECWLLPLYYENDASRRCATHNCIYILNQKLQREGLGLPSKDKNAPEATRIYQRVLKKMKGKDIPRIAQYNVGFRKFVEQLDAIRSASD